MYISEEAYNTFLKRVSRHYPKESTKDVVVSDWTVAGTIGKGIGIPAIIKAALKSNNLYNIAFASSLLAFIPTRPMLVSFWTNDDKTIQNAEIEAPAKYVAGFLITESNKELGCFNCFCNDAKIALIELRDYLNNAEHFNKEYATFGVAQKWLNIAIKHFYTLCRMCENKEINDVCNSRLFECAGFPIDNLIKVPIKKDLGISYTKYFPKAEDGKNVSWTHIDDVDQIIAYEKAVLEKLKELNMNCLFEFEYTNWRKDN